MDSWEISQFFFFLSQKTKTKIYKKTKTKTKKGRRRNVRFLMQGRFFLFLLFGVPTGLVWKVDRPMGFSPCCPSDQPPWEANGPMDHWANSAIATTPRVMDGLQEKMVGVEKAHSASKLKVLDDRGFVFYTRANYNQQDLYLSWKKIITNKKEIKWLEAYVGLGSNLN